MLLPLMASAQSVEIDGIYYDLPPVWKNPKTVSVASNPNKYSGDITIPNSIIYEDVEYKVTQIGDNAFGGCFELSSVTIPESVTQIGQNAFQGCYNLSSVTIPQSITTMRFSAFGGCHGLKVYITDLESWCKISFYNESSNPLNASGQLFLNGEEVHDLVIPDGVQNINYFAFYGCKSITSLKLPKSVISIGEYAFCDCENLKDVFCKVGMIEMGAHSFSSSKITLHVPANSVDIYQNAGFKAVVALDNSEVSGREIYLASAGSLPTFISEEEKYTIEELTLSGELNGTDIRLLRDMAGNNYKGEFTGGKLRSLDLSAARIVAGGDFYLETNYIVSNISFAKSQMSIQNNDEIPQGAFAGCHLLNIILPAGINKISDQAFGGCYSLKSIFIPWNVQSISPNAFLECNELVSIIVSSSNSKYSSWQNCNSIIDKEANELIIGCRNSKIPHGVISIGEGAFACTNLNSISIPGSVTRIKKGAFKRCYLGKVTFGFPVGLNEIDDDAFSGCSGLTSIKIPSTVSYIAPTAFANCSSLASIQVDDQNPVYFSPNNCNAIIEASTQKLILGCKKSTIPDGVTAIGNLAFLSCKGLLSISIPNSVKSIGNDAFRNCSGLSTITISQSVESIGVNAFYGCSGLKDVYCEAVDVPITDASSFSNSNIENASLQVPENSISDYKQATPWSSFKDISAIRIINNVTIDGITYQLSTEGYIAEVIQGTETYTGEVVIPKKVFYEDHEFVVMRIGNDAFNSCNNLTSITIPNSVMSIGEWAFSNCSSLKTIYCKAEIVPVTDITIFDGTNQDNITLYVPGGRVNIYKSVEPWDKIVHIEENYVAIETPLTFEAVDGTVTVDIRNYYCSLMPTIQFSIDGGPWTDFTLSNNDCQGSAAYSNCLPAGKIVQLRAELPGGIGDRTDDFEINCLEDCYVSGNVNSIKKGEAFAEDYSVAEGMWGWLFHNNTHLKNHPTKDIVLPATTLNKACYRGMFKGCTGLTRAPKLPATTLAESCYAGMFMGCTSLTEAPELPATKLEKWCYVKMFEGCTNLKYIKCHANENIIAGDDANYNRYIEAWYNDDENGTVTSWLKDAGTNVTGTKTFIVNESLTITGVDPLTATVENWGERSVSGIPEGWALGNLKGETESIKISSAKQVTYMSDKNLDFTTKPELKAYVATGYDKASGTIWLTRVKEVPANTGFLLMGEADTYEIPVKAGGLSSYYQNMFKGTLEATTIYTTDGNYTNYYLSNGESGVGFYKVTKEEGVTLGKNRAYLPLPTEIPVVGTAGSTETIKVSSAGQVPYYNTESLDFSSLDAQGVKAYTATGYDYNSGTIWLTRVKQVPAETGILIMAPEGEYPVPTASVSSVYANMFRGTLEGTTIQTHEEIDGKDYINYYLSSGASGVGFYRVTKEEGVKIKANRCYLPILNKDAAAGTRSSSSDVNQIAFEEADEVIGIQLLRGIGGDDDGTTSIKDLTPALSEGEGAWYTLQGQRVAKPGKGLYIRNGKKVVIK